MVYWVEFEKQSWSRERGGDTLVKAREWAYIVLNKGRYGKSAQIYDGQKWIGTCYVRNGKGYYITVFGKKYRLHEDGSISEIMRKAPFGL